MTMTALLFHIEPGSLTWEDEQQSISRSISVGQPHFAFRQTRRGPLQEFEHFVLQCAHQLQHFPRIASVCKTVHMLLCYSNKRRRFWEMCNTVFEHLLLGPQHRADVLVAHRFFICTEVLPSAPLAREGGKLSTRVRVIAVPRHTTALASEHRVMASKLCTPVAAVAPEVGHPRCQVPPQQHYCLFLLPSEKGNARQVNLRILKAVEGQLFTQFELLLQPLLGITQMYLA